jgi:predicted enzyme related to lactoylglutathione lyase
MPRPVHFEFVAEDPERAARFWSAAFGWKIERWGEQRYWVVSTAPDGSDEPGIDGGIADKASFELPGHTIVTLAVDSVDDAVARVQAAGGEVVAPKMPIPGVGWLAYFRDPEGVVFGTLQPDESATMDAGAAGDATVAGEGATAGSEGAAGGAPGAT